jgi:hypothetical protein
MNKVRAKGYFYKGYSLLPKNVTTHIDIMRRKKYWKSKGVVFIHVPKNAGVSISKALYGRPLGHFYASDIRKTVTHIFDQSFTFGISRHPLDRIYSAYRFASSGGEEMSFNGDNRLIRKLTFEEFVFEWLAYQDLSCIDGIFRPQHLYLCKSSEIIVNKVFKFDELNSIQKYLSSVVGHDILVPHANKTTMCKDKLANHSRSVQQTIEELYAKDFEIFGY